MTENKRNSARICAFFLSVMVLFLTLPAGIVSAEDANIDTWNGGVETSWYNSEKPSENYEVTTAEQLAGLAALVNQVNQNITFTGVTFTLEKDLDLAGYEWTSIGIGDEDDSHFGGIFDGNGHVIYNVKSTGSTVYHALFGVISRGGEVRNLGVENAKIETPSGDRSPRIGVLADWVNNGIIENCYTTGTLTCNTGEKCVGGLIAVCTGSTTVTCCYSEVAVDSNDPNKGELGDDDTVGGLIGQWENADNNSLISNCYFAGSIDCEFEGAAVGGILGVGWNMNDDIGVTIKNCFVSTTDISCPNPENITWIAADLYPSVTDCYWPSPEHTAVVKLVSNSDGTAGPDPEFDESRCGQTVTDFTSADLVTKLNAVKNCWTAGAAHPTFTWDARGQEADYSALNTLKNTIPADLSAYTAESVAALNKVLQSIDWGLSKKDQAVIDEYVLALKNAIDNLVLMTTPSPLPEPSIPEPTVTVTTQKNGWDEIGSNTVYYKRGRKVTGFIEIDGETYYFDQKGYLQKGWLELDEGWYYLDPVSGAMATGWEKVKNTWYYFDPETGLMAADGLYTVDGKTYYFYSWGGMASSWWYEAKPGEWYYFRGNGELAINAWIEWKGEYYFVGTDGEMLVSAITPDGYTVGADGAWIS